VLTNERAGKPAVFVFSAKSLQIGVKVRLRSHLFRPNYALNIRIVT
jgi:hypothetical protein